MQVAVKYGNEKKNFYEKYWGPDRGEDRRRSPIHQTLKRARKFCYGQYVDRSKDCGVEERDERIKRLVLRETLLEGCGSRTCDGEYCHWAIRTFFSFLFFFFFSIEALGITSSSQLRYFVFFITNARARAWRHLEHHINSRTGQAQT